MRRSREPLERDAAVAEAELVHLAVVLAGDRQQEVREGRFLLLLDVPVALDRPAEAARKQRRDVDARVLVALAHAAAVEDQRVIEQRAVAVGRGLELREELRVEA